MSDMQPYLVFVVGARRFALPLASVQRITRAVAVLPLPGAGAAVLGVVNLQGRLLPVLSLHQWLALPARDLQLSDQFVIVKIAAWTVVLVVDAVAGLLDCLPEHVTPTGQIMPDLPTVGGVSGVAAAADGLILITDLPPLLALLDCHLVGAPALAGAR